MEDPIKTIKILYNCRDIRNGKGHKKISRTLFAFIKKEYPKLYELMLEDIVELGSWKDLLHIAQDTIETENNIEVSMFSKQLLDDVEMLKNNKNVSLCAQWGSK